MNSLKDQIWKILTENRLVGESDLEPLRQSYESIDGEKPAEHLIDWLLDQGVLTPLQHEVLVAGIDGPFVWRLSDSGKVRARGAFVKSRDGIQ